jgi:hypothetical protein
MRNPTQPEQNLPLDFVFEDRGIGHVEALAQPFEVIWRGFEREELSDKGNRFPADFLAFQILVAPSLDLVLDDVADAEAMLVGELVVLNAVEIDPCNGLGQSLGCLLGRQPKIVGEQIGADVRLHSTNSPLSQLLWRGPDKATEELSS